MAELMGKWESIVTAFGLGVAVGTIAVGIFAALVTARHRTQGARRLLAANATKEVLDRLEKLPASDVIRLQAELFSYYYRTIRVAEEGRQLLADPSPPAEKALADKQA